jgi:hypothetical protein
MKLLLFTTILATSLFASANETQLGVILGSTTGLSAKYDLGGDRAIDGALAYSLNSRFGFAIHADYLFNKARQFNVENSNAISLYYGLGIRLEEIRNRYFNETSSTRVGVRAPIGVHYRISDPALEFFAEIVPVFDITPRSDVSFDAGIGVRFIF